MSGESLPGFYEMGMMKKNSLLWLQFQFLIPGFDVEFGQAS